MEESKSRPTRRRASKRIPLIDLSNVIPPSLSSSQSSSSSLIKSQIKSSLSLPLKPLPSNTNSHLSSKLTATNSIRNNNNSNFKKKENDECSSSKGNPSSKLSPPPKTPSVSVYRRYTAENRNSKGKKNAEPLSCIFETRISNLRKKKDADGDIFTSKPCPMPRKKKQDGVKAETYTPMHNLSQDFIDKQRAYFAEVDAFELEEEVASSGDELK